MRYIEQRYDFKDNPLPSSSGFLSFILRENYGQEIAEVCQFIFSMLDTLPSLRSNKQLFTLLNVTNHTSKYSVGKCNTPPAECIPINAKLSFTFALSPLQEYDGAELDVWRRTPFMRTFTTNTKSSTEFVTVAISPTEANTYKLQGTLRCLQALYYLCGMYTKQLARNPRLAVTEVKYDMPPWYYKRKYLMQSLQTFMNNTSPAFFAFNKKVWNSPELIADKYIDDNVLIYFYLNVRTFGSYTRPSIVKAVKTSFLNLLQRSTEQVQAKEDTELLFAAVVFGDKVTNTQDLYGYDRLLVDYYSGIAMHDVDGYIVMLMNGYEEAFDYPFYVR